MKPRFGLQARFLALVGVTFLVVVCLLFLLLHKERQQQDAVEAQSLEAMHDMAMETLRLRGEGITAQLADRLANPLYYFDLETIGQIIQGTRRQPDVSYVLVFDPQGRVVHDGSWGFASSATISASTLSVPVGRAPERAPQRPSCNKMGCSSRPQSVSS